MTPVSARTPNSQDRTARSGNADLWAVLPVGPGTAARRAAAAKTTIVEMTPVSARTPNSQDRAASQGTPTSGRLLCLDNSLSYDHLTCGSEVWISLCLSLAVPTTRNLLVVPTAARKDGLRRRGGLPDIVRAFRPPSADPPALRPAEFRPPETDPVTCETVLRSPDLSKSVFPSW